MLPLALEHNPTPDFAKLMKATSGEEATLKQPKKLPFIYLNRKPSNRLILNLHELLKEL
jgi:hypothetical protein